MNSYTDTYGEMDEVFIIPGIQTNYISNSVDNVDNVKAQKPMTTTIPKKQSILLRTEKQRKIARIESRRNRARRKAEFLASLKYCESLLKMNEKLKYEMYHLKNRRDKLLQQCRKNLIN